MPTTKPNFTQRELARALRAMRDAGMKPKAVDIDHKRGRISISLDDGSTIEATTEDETETWIRKHAHQR
jgi:hypothetical protein